MPEALTKKMFGLPRWAWLAILAAAIGIGLYLRYKHKKEEEEQGTSEESPVGVTPTEAVPVGGYNEDGEGGFYGYGGGGGGGYGGYEGFNEALPQESENNHEVNINIGEPSLPSATDGEEHGSIPNQQPCSVKPKVPKGYKAECVSGHWKLVAKTNKIPHEPPPTGGGPPDRPGNKGPGAPPTHDPQHPTAVNTGNRCVNGGVGPHSAPPGYHLFCDGGWIWRAPNSAGGGSGGGGGGGSPAPAPAPAPAPPPSGWCGHPNAVPTGNACVNGGVGGHTAPPGYHLFCCNGMIGRAPN